MHIQYTDKHDKLKEKMVAICAYRMTVKRFDQTTQNGVITEWKDLFCYTG